MTDTAPDRQPTTPPVAAPRARVSAQSARWQERPWSSHGQRFDGVTVPFTTAAGAASTAQHGTRSHMARGTFANVYSGMTSDHLGNHEIVVKYLKTDEAYANQIVVDRLLASAAARNPRLRSHFLYSLGWFRSTPERLAGGGSFCAQGVVQQRVDGPCMVRGGVWLEQIRSATDRDRQSAALGVCLATALIELNRKQPVGNAFLHTDIKPANYSLSVDKGAPPTCAMIYDMGALRQEGRRIDGFEATVPYNDTNTLVDPGFSLDLNSGTAATSIDRHHTHSVACNVLVAATGMDDEHLCDHAARLAAVETIANKQLRGMLRAALSPDPERRPSLVELRQVLSDLVEPVRVTPPRPTTPTPTQPWLTRAARSLRRWFC